MGPILSGVFKNVLIEFFFPKFLLIHHLICNQDGFKQKKRVSYEVCLLNITGTIMRVSKWPFFNRVNWAFNAEFFAD